jgi:PAS domain S-box-containing protein
MTTQESSDGKLLQDALHEAQARLESVLASVAEIHFLLSREWRFLYVNDAAAQAIGRPREEIVGHTLWELYPDIVGTELDRQYHRAMDERLAFTFDFHYLTLDAWWENRFFPAPDGLAIFAINITERKQAEERLRKQKEVLQTVFDHIPVMISLVDSDNRFRMVNREWEQKLGWSLDELTKSGVDVLSEFYPDPEDRERVKEFIGKSNGEFGDFQIRTRDGKRIDTAWTRIQLSDGSSIGMGEDLTSRKRAEQARLEAEEKYRDIFEHAGEGIFQTTPDGQFIAANPAMARMYGFDSPEEIVSSLRDISRQVYVDPVRREEFKSLLAEHGVVRGFEHQAFRKDGSKIWVSLNARAVYDARGTILYYEGTTQDINERRRAEARSAAFATLARKLSGARTPLDAGRIIAKIAGDLFEWDSCNLDLYDADRDLVHPMLKVDRIDGRQTDVTGFCSERAPTPRSRRVIAHGAQVLLREEPIQFDQDAVPFGDATRPSASIMTVPISHAEKIIGLLSIQSYTVHGYSQAALDDLQALADHCGEALNRIKAEQSLFESEERFRQMADHFEDVVWVANKDLTEVFYVNPAYERIFGRTLVRPGEPLDFQFEEVHPEDRGTVQSRFAARAAGEHQPFEYRTVRPDGSIRWIHSRSFPIRNNEGEVYRVAGIAQDITERKRAEEALLASERNYRNIVAFAPVGIYQSLRDGTLITANKTLVEMLGYTSVDELLRINLGSGIYLSENDRERLIGEYEGLGYPFDFDMQWKRKDGSPIWVQLSVNAIKGPKGETEYFEGFVRDITERKRAERERDAISEVIQSVNLTSNLEELLTQVHQSLGRVLYAENCCVVLYNQQTGLLEAPFFVDLVEPNPFPMALSKSCTAKVFTSGQPLLMNEAIYAGLLERGEVELLGRPAPSYLAVPMMTPSETLGVIVVQHYEKDNVYNQRDVEFLSAVAAQLARAIERKRAEEALRESEERYRDLVENSRELICTHDLDGLVLSANPAAAAAVGYDLDELVGKKTIRELLAPEVSHQFDLYMARLLNERSTSGIMIMQTRSGERRVWEYYNSIRTEGVPRPIVRGMARDITEQRRTEQSLRLFRNLIDQSNDAIEVLDPVTFRFIDCNESAYRSLGYTREEFLSLTVFDIDPVVTPESLAELNETSGFATLESVHVRKDGTTFPVEVNVKLIRLERVYRLAVVRDISGRKQAAEALRQSEERYRELFENAKDAIYVHDLGGRYLSVNRAAEELIGFSREEILGKHFSNFVSPRDLKHVRTNLCRKLDEENETIYEVNVVNRNGSRIPVEVSSRLIYEKGVAMGIQGTARDITDRKRAQEALRIYSQRLIEAQEAERQKIARELHDEIGQVLTAVRINLQSIQRSCRTDECLPQLDDSVAIVDEALGSVRELSIELRPALLDDLGLSAALRWYVDRYAQRTGITARVLNGLKEDTRLPRELETACFRIAQEALTNVARHAQASNVSVQLERSRERMLLTIIDDGIGFDISKLRKSASPAAALGLRGMEERALVLGGYIEIESGSESGTQIRATFPLKRK